MYKHSKHSQQMILLMSINVTVIRNIINLNIMNLLILYNNTSMCVMCFVCFCMCIHIYTYGHVFLFFQNTYPQKPIFLIRLL